jgi:hypothetical protein
MLGPIDHNSGTLLSRIKITFLEGALWPCPRRLWQSHAGLARAASFLGPNPGPAPRLWRGVRGGEFVPAEPSGLGFRPAHASASLVRSSSKGDTVSPSA